MSTSVKHRCSATLAILPETPLPRSEDLAQFSTQNLPGWRPGQRAREGRIGSLLLGVQGPDGLEYAGHVGTGFTQAMLTDLVRLLGPPRRASSPFGTPVLGQHIRGTRWVEPG